ncbi:PREDICTED: C2 domain-containing protein 3 [Nanorana parkeri]|uniref:C2 domain-containing protein 3 n=1 Tax=Nanorana parkeri TaxID=125878 RepID=UPI0008542366|nr:PREDICTED: C2 domain-containing protein 3 [Nanorana parkeri]
MKSRGEKSRRKRGTTDVSPSTSLPPLVEGQLRCFLRVTVGKILWTVPRPPPFVLVRLRWWGETSEGTIFHPRDTSQTEQKTVKTTTRYAVRCGPKQFTSYLTDMGALVLEVMTKLDHLPLSRAQINGISRLSPTHPISGFFTLVSPASEKLGELQVSVALEPLCETYDSNSSVPNTDVSQDAGLSGCQSKPHSKLSVNPRGRRDSETSRASTPRGRDHLYFKENAEPHLDPLKEPQDHSNQKDVYVSDIHTYKENMTSAHIAQERFTADRPKEVSGVPSTPAAKDLLADIRSYPYKTLRSGCKFLQQESVNTCCWDHMWLLTAVAAQPLVDDPSTQAEWPHLSRATQDSAGWPRLGTLRAGPRLGTLWAGPASWEEVLLQQGSKLRDAMAESAMRLDPSMDMEPLDKENYTSQAVRAALDFPPPHIHQNLRNLPKPSAPKDIILHPTDQTFSELDVPNDTRAIELLLGSTPISLGQYWDGTGSPPESIAGSEFYESELNDPQYDQSLLENLFYSVPKILDDFSSDEQSRSVTKGSKNRPVEDEEQNLKQHKSAERPLGDRTRTEAIDLSVDRLALLGRMHTARVVVESLKVKPETTQVTPGKKGSKGKPPRPASSIKRTYFVEFQFPVSSKSKVGEVSVATEITRLVSSKIVNGVVKFQQKFVFPVLFSGHVIKHWWSTDLTFTVFLRKGTQQKPSALGSAAFCLRDVLRSEDLSVSHLLPVHKSEGGQEMEDVGPLKVSVDIVGDGHEFSRVPEKQSGVAHEASSTSLRHSVRIAAPEHQSDKESSPEPEPLTSIHPLDSPASHHVPRKEPQPALSQETAEENGLLLHVVLMVVEGTGLIPSPDSTTCNSYLNCKLFSSLEATRSNVVWGSSKPVYNFSQVAPVNLTSRLLERMKNNVMIVEVWSKVSSPGSDQLMGLVKLPLHQFFMSFSDQKICRLLLQAQYPVVAVDNFVPISDVFSGTERGRLKVLLAMGSGDQVVALQRLKNDEGTLTALLPRPAHFLDPPQPTAEVSRAAESAVDHVFDIHVENVKGLTPLQSTVWGEADCYVQYYFPVQTPVTGLEAELPERSISLKPVRTATTLCVPDPVFNDRQSHTLVSPSDTPVQRLLLSAYSTQGLSGGGGVTFEIWCRYYYPNVRDQMVAKGVLPLSRLCAMVTMHHREEVGIQAFCLPLTLRSENAAETHPSSSGLLNVNVTYRRSVRNPVGILATRMVSISVQIHRAAGLQAAARALAEQDPSFQYSADVGVNAFVIIRPSFLPEMESRSTRTVARSFCPEFDHHSEFPCNILTQRSSGEACSLAEILHFSEIVLSIHHQSVASAGVGTIHPTCDYHLGVVRIPTRVLLSKRSGISGWYPVMLPEDSTLPSTAGIMNNVVGGLELSVNFTHHSDRDRALEVAQGLGWNVEEEVIRSVGDGWEKEDLVNLSVTVPKIWLPVHCLLLAGHKQIHKNIYCYLRYKLYDRDAVCSHLRKPALSENGQQATIVFEQTRTIELMKHQPLVWYLREEKLEIQIWRSYGKDTSGQRPQDTDRLLGCVYVDMTALAETTSRTLSVSGVYPLFKRNVPNLQGAALRVHLSLSSAYHPSVTAQCTSSAEDQSLSEEEAVQDSSGEDDRRKDDRTETKKSSPRVGHPPAVSDSQPVCVDMENTFAVNIVVERAMHLSLKGTPLTERQVPTPSCCVSFPVAGTATPVTTPVIEDTDSPTWNFQHQTRLTKELLLDPQQTLVFKVWHRTDVERVLGFASVDLSPLLSGFQSVCGWYNIGDFTGQCQGQIKVSITPLETIAYLKEERQTRSCTANVQSQVTPHTSFLYQPSPIFSFPVHQTGNAGNFVTPTERREVSFPPVGNAEHTETMRRFQETLHQAEQNTWSTEHRDVLSQSSRTSLQSALGKNLNELDDIQKYFNQKLYRSLPSTAPPGGTTEHSAEKKPHIPTSSEEDADTRLLLKKSSLLVSQVSNLITGLQEKSALREVAPSTVDGGSSHRHLSVSGSEVIGVRPSENVWPAIHKELSDDENEVHHVDTPPFSEAGSPIRKKDNMEDLLDYNERPGSFVGNQEEEPEDDLQQDSDEDYEESVIEIRTLNEITTLTDRTSPWSSMVSEPGHDPETAMEDVPTNANLLERLSLVSSDLQDDQNSNPNTARSCDSHMADKYPEMTGNGSDTHDHERWVESQNIGSLSQSSSDLSDSGEEDRLREEELTLEVTRLPTEMSLSGSEPDESGDLVIEREDTDGEMREDYRSGYPSSSSHPESSPRDTSPSEQSVEELPDATDTIPHFNLLFLSRSDPIQLPNFFLPPQHLEASMRLLSQASLPSSSSAQKADGETSVTKGIPFRRRMRQTPKINADDVPEKEAKRIARIFAAQFSNK